MAVTLKDVAKRAGVSVSTASVVIRRDPKLSINVNTRKRVLAAARELNYAPNMHARLLSGGRSRLIGLTVLDDYGELTYTKQRLIQRLISDRGYESVLRDAGTNGTDHADCIQDFLRSRAEGVIAVQGFKGLNAESLRQLHSNNIPVVSLGDNENSEYISTVTVDIHKGAYLAVKHLTDLGHQKIGILLSATAARSISSRILGSAAALTEAGIPQEPSLWAELPPDMSPATFAGGYDCAKSLLHRRPDVTAMFCSNDEVAIGAIKAINELGLRVPEDISVVGFDDLPMSAYLQVPLTTIAQPADDVVRECVDMLFRHIDAPEPLNGPSHSMLEPTLVVRKSTSPPRA